MSPNWLLFLAALALLLLTTACAPVQANAAAAASSTPVPGDTPAAPTVFATALPAALYTLPEPIVTEQFVNKNGWGFSLSYPTVWRMGDMGGGLSIYNHGFDETGRTVLPGGSLKMDVAFDPDGDMPDLEGLAHDGITIDETFAIEVGGETGLAYVFHGGPSAQYNLAVYVKHGPGLFFAVAYIYGSEEECQVLAGAARQIIATVQFIDGLEEVTPVPIYP